MWPDSFDDWLRVVEVLAILLLWLFYVGRWVGRRDGKPSGAPSVVIPPPDPTALERRLTMIEAELDRARTRLHKLEGWQQQTTTKLSYLDRDVERLMGRPRDL